GFPWLLTGITDESGHRFSTYAYDTAGRASSSQHAGGADLYTFSYGQYGTTVTYPSGFSGGFAFVNKGGVQRPYSLPVGCPDCDNVQSITYDANANVSQTTDASSTTTFGFDLTRNLET